jgi:hypothetical protein
MRFIVDTVKLPSPRLAGAFTRAAWEPYVTGMRK